MVKEKQLTEQKGCTEKQHMVLQLQFVPGFAKKQDLYDHKIFGEGSMYDIICLSDACIIFDALVN